MGQITIYLDNDHEHRLRTAAHDAGIPVSRWVAMLIETHTLTRWPAEVRESAGSWPNAPDAAEMRNHQGIDTPREPL